MKRRQISMACAAALLLLALSGCQLAREDAGEGVMADRLIGALVTEQSIGGFCVSDGPAAQGGGWSGSVIGPEGAATGHPDRLYASLVVRTLTDGQTGARTDAREYAFEGVEGIAYFAATVPEDQREEAFIANGSDEAIADGHMSVHVGDSENSTSLEGTIYLSVERKGVLYINPVYQSADGRVYALRGNGVLLDGVEGEGSVYTYEMEEVQTVREAGEEKSERFSIRLSLVTMRPPREITILQMDAQSAILSRTQYAPGQLPDELALAPEVAYLLVETRGGAPGAQAAVTRAVYGRDDELLPAFYCREDGVCVKQWTQLAWQDAPGMEMEG